MTQGLYDLAIRHLSKAVSVDSNAIYHVNRAEAYARNGQCDKAITDAETALQRETVTGTAYHSEAAAHAVMSTCYRIQGKKTLAARHEEKAASIAAIHGYISRKVIAARPDPTVVPAPTEQQAAAALRAPTATPVPLPLSPAYTPITAPTATATPRPTSTPKPTPTPMRSTLMDLDKWRSHVIGLINLARNAAELGPVTLSNNSAAQQHAEALLRHNFRGHWGMDGLTPPMRYILAGGTNYVQENVSSYVLREGILYNKQSPQALLTKSHAGLMNSPGHRRNILNKWHKKVSLGISCNAHACSMVQNFEGDYVEFDTKPVISSRGVLRFAGLLKDGFTISGIQVWYHESPHPLTLGQLDATYSYGVGQEPVTFVIEPAPVGSYYSKENLIAQYSWTAGVDPYSVDPETPRNRGSITPQLRLSPQKRFKTIPYTIADIWSRSASGFQIRANISNIIEDLGPGVYIIVIWGEKVGEEVPLTNYAIFVD